MADDLRERIRRGDLAALADPALPLHLLADGPGANWWVVGRRKMLLALARELREQGSNGRDEATRSGPTDDLTEAWRKAMRSGDPADDLGFLLRYRALLPSVSPAIDAALDALKRYTG